jgi:hypothetical protein
MFITTHVLASIVISQHTPNPWWAFAVSFFSHYFLDIIPHGDKPIEDWLQKGSHFKKSILVFGFDLLLISIFFFTLYSKMTLPRPGIVLAAIIGGTLPDVLWVLYDMHHRYLRHTFLSKVFIIRIESILEHHRRLHHYIEHLIKDKLSPQYLGAIVQIIFAGIFIFLALFPY